MGTFWQDLRLGLRLAASRPAFTAVAAVVLSLGIGPNTAIFSVVDAMLLTEPPYPDPERILTVAQLAPGLADRVRPTVPSTDDFQDWRRETKTLAHIALYAPDSLTLTGHGDPVRLNGARVSPAMFPLLGVRPVIGRTFTDDEESPSAAPVVVISQALWEQKLGRDRSILGRMVVLDGVGRQVIGIMPRSFVFPTPETEYWTPFVITPPERNPNERRIAVVPFLARLSPGATIDQASLEGDAIIARAQEADLPAGMTGGPEGRGGSGRRGESGERGSPADDEGRAGREGRVGPGEEQVARAEGASGRAQPVVREAARGRAGPGREGRPEQAGGPEQAMARERVQSPRGAAGPERAAPAPRSRLPFRLVTLQERQSGPARPALLVLWAAVAFVLLIACANVANLMLSRAAARHREMAVRAALGAGRIRIVRQLLTESAVLSVIGGGAGLLLAAWMIRLLPRIAPAGVPRLAEVRLDGRVLLFALLASLVATVLFGLAPAVAAARLDLVRSLKESGAGGAAAIRSPGRRGGRSALTVTQIALALMLLIGAGLLTRSLVALLGQTPGYDPEGALTVQVRLPRARYPLAQNRAAFLDQALAMIRQAPGVRAAGATNLMPMSQARIGISFDLPGVPLRADQREPVSAGVRLVSADFFKALGTRLLAGREFSEADQADRELVTIVNQAFVTRYLPGLDPVGRPLDMNGPRRIVGVVESMKPQGLDSEPVPEMYFPLGQFGQLLMVEGPLSDTTIVVRTAGDPLAVVPAIRTEIARIDPQLAIFNITTLVRRVSDSVAQPRLYAVVLSIFAGLALALAAVGIYGVLSSQVAQSTREIGIQMALGAGPARVVRSVMAQGAGLAAIGVVIGLAGAWALSRFVASLLFGVQSYDPGTYAGAAGVLGAVALLGAWLPARRATGVDPVVALRYE